MDYRVNTTKYKAAASSSFTDYKVSCQPSAIFNNITELVGNTPLVRQGKIFPESDVIAKLEEFNPVGSIKDRTALYMIENLLKQGKIDRKTTIIESSSGNLAIGLARICKLLYGLKFIAVVDPKITPTNLKLLELSGAKIEFVTECDATGNYQPKRIERVKEICLTDKKIFWTNQYDSEDNPDAHYYGIGQELVDQLCGYPVDYFVAAVSTTGTLTGTSRRLKLAYPNIKVIAVDEEGSCLFNGSPARRFIPGIGFGFPLPQIAVKAEQEDVMDGIIRVTANEAIQGCYDLLDSEGILAGGSSGAVVAALKKLIPTIPTGSSILTIFPDRGERYLDTIYNPEWVKNKLYPPQLNIAA